MLRTRRSGRLRSAVRAGVAGGAVFVASTIAAAPVLAAGGLPGVNVGHLV